MVQSTNLLLFKLAIENLSALTYHSAEVNDFTV